jgi:hypothetical protein
MSRLWPLAWTAVPLSTWAGGQDALRDEVDRAIGRVPGLAAEPAPSGNTWPSIADNALDVTMS